MEISLTNLFWISVIAFAVPFALGFAPRLRIPAVVLEIVAGIVIGPAVLGWVKIDEPVSVMATLGVAFLLFLAGLELDFDALKGRPLLLGAAGYAISLAIALVGAQALGFGGLVKTPLLIAVALSSTSVGIIIPVLKDTGNLNTPVGLLTVAGGSAAEFGSIALLGVFFAAPADSIAEEVLIVIAASAVLVVLAVVMGLLLFLIAKAVRWREGRRVAMRMDETSSQLRVRFAVMLLLGTAVLATAFGFEAILGTFLAGIFVAGIIKGDSHERLYRARLEAIGFGFFVPVFFVSSGMKLSLDGALTASVLGKVLLFLVLLLIARGVPALLYRHRTSRRGVIACGLMQATNVSFIVVAVAVGLELERVAPATGSALVFAGLLSAIIFPAAAQMVLAGDDAGTPEAVHAIEATDSGNGTRPAAGTPS